MTPRKYLLIEQEHYYILKISISNLEKLIRLNAPKKLLNESLEKINNVVKLIKEIDEVI